MRRRTAPADQSGQTLVEFAVVLPVFLLVVFGLFDVGRAVFANSVLSQAAREGARLAAAEAAWIAVPDPGCVSEPGLITAANPGAHVCPASAADLKAHVVSAAQASAVSVGAITVSISCNDGTADDPVPTGSWTDAPGRGGNGCALGGAMGDVVSVRLEHAYLPFTPFVSSLLGPLSLSGSAAMVIH